MDQANDEDTNWRERYTRQGMPGIRGIEPIIPEKFQL